jgi:NAD-dependent dihydropyrimidine dehydrogenase PreA subunit
MRLCEFAKATGKSCEDGWSKTILCEKDGVLRCLKECTRNCPMGSYDAKEEVVSVQQQRKVSSYNPHSAVVRSEKYGCGGCGGNTLNK